MKSYHDEDSTITVVVALVVALMALAAFLLPAPPDDVPEIEKAETAHLVNIAEASEIESKTILIEVVKADKEEPVEHELNPALKPVCACESAGRRDREPVHYEEDGRTPLIGRIDSDDRGMCQLNLRYHQRSAEAQGLDVLGRKEDYIEYVNHLFETQGYTPWNASRHCWDK